MPRHKADRIPLIGRTLDVGGIISRNHIHVVTNIIKKRFAPSAFAGAFHHCVDIVCNLFGIALVAWLVVYFKCYDGAVVGIALPCIWVDMCHKGFHVSLLSLYRFLVGMDVAFWIVIGVGAGIDIFFGIPVAEVCLCGDYYGNPALFKLCY